MHAENNTHKWVQFTEATLGYDTLVYYNISLHANWGVKRGMIRTKCGPDSPSQFQHWSYFALKINWPDKDVNTSIIEKFA